VVWTIAGTLLALRGASIALPLRRLACDPLAKT